MSWASSGGASARQSAAAADHLGHVVLEGLADLGRAQTDGLGHPGRDLAAADLRLLLVLVGVGGADGELHLLGGALPDRHAVAVADVGLDGRVEVEAAAADGPLGHHPAERDHRRLGGAAAHVDHHRADRLVDGEAGADGGGHRLLDEVGGRRAGVAGRLPHGPALDPGDGRGDADEDPGPADPGHPAAVQQHPQHALGDVEVGDRPLAEGADGHDVAGGPPDHLPGLRPDGEHLAAAGVVGDDGRLVEHDALALGVDEGVGRAQVDREVAGHSAHGTEGRPTAIASGGASVTWIVVASSDGGSFDQGSGEPEEGERDPSEELSGTTAPEAGSRRSSAPGATPPRPGPGRPRPRLRPRCSGPAARPARPAWATALVGAGAVAALVSGGLMLAIQEPRPRAGRRRPG